MEGEEEYPRTKSGYRYTVDKKNNLRIRDCLTNRRLEEDDETHEEYKARQKAIKNYEKTKREGEMIWPSKNLNDTTSGQISENTLGTFNKEKLQQIKQEIEQEEEQEDQKSDNDEG